jgi:hypothetical protein
MFHSKDKEQAGDVARRKVGQDRAPESAHDRSGVRPLMLLGY